MSGQGGPQKQKSAQAPALRACAAVSSYVAFHYAYICSLLSLSDLTSCSCHELLHLLLRLVAPILIVSLVVRYL
jgi:hypothetical protein